MSQVEVKALGITNTDLTVVNAARVSFAKKTDKMRPRDERLIGYLWRNRHWAPIASGHMLFDMTVPLGSRNVFVEMLIEKGPGIRVKVLQYDRVICAMSLYWILENWDLLPSMARRAVIDRFPIACAASGRKLSSYLRDNSPFLSGSDDLTCNETSIEADRLRQLVPSLNEWDIARLTTFSLHVKAPIFLARQLGKHQVDLVWSEISRRYVSGEPELFSPAIWRKRNPDAKQGSLDEPADWVPMHRTAKFMGGSSNVRMDPSASHKLWNRLALAYYDDLIAGGVAPEQARMELPQSMLTEWYWTGSVAAFARCYAQRGPYSHGAQEEARMFATMMDAQIAKSSPYLWMNAKATANAIQKRNDITHTAKAS